MHARGARVPCAAVFVASRYPVRCGCLTNRPVVTQRSRGCKQSVTVNSRPCASGGGAAALKAAACSAAALGVDLVLAVIEAVACGGVDSGGGEGQACPPDGVFLYNTQVALNASGAVRAGLRAVRASAHA